MLVLCLFWATLPLRGDFTVPHDVNGLYGHAALEIVRHPDRLEACLLRQRDDGKVFERTRRIVVAGESRKAISALLIDNRSYGWEMFKPCIPDYGARLIFRKGPGEVVVDFCFACDILSVSSGGIEDFDAVRDFFLRFFKESFPGDRLIQKAE